MRFRFVFSFASCLVFSRLMDGSFIEVEGYTPQMLQGWVVYVSDELREQRPEESERALLLLKGQCRKVIHVVPSSAVSELQKVRLWLSLPSEERRPRAEFHPSKDWLIENGMHPEKEKVVEFTPVQNKLNRR